MNRDATKQETNPLRHNCYMTSGRIGFVSYFDLSDLLVIGGAFYISTLLSAKLFVSPPPKLLLTLLVVALAWSINFRVKKKLMPYPGLMEHWFNWYFGGIDYYLPDVDENPTPLIVTRELQVGEAVDRAASTVRMPKQKRQRPVRRRRVQTQEAGAD